MSLVVKPSCSIETPVPATGLRVAPACAAVLDPPVLDMNIGSTSAAVALQWTQATEPDNNEIRRSQNGGGFSAIATQDGALLEYDDNDGLGPGDIWCYQVRGVTGAVESDFSNIVCAVLNVYFPSTGAIAHPTWVMAFGDFGGDDNSLMISLNLSKLKRVTGNLYLDSAFILTSLNLNALQIVDADLHLSLANALTSLSLPALTTISGNLYCDNCPLLTSVSLPLLQYQNGKSYFFDSCALDAASVNAILARAVVSGVVSATITLDGGTNASPTGQGILDLAALLAAGNTVSTN